jgi:hypothetical protein
MENMSTHELNEQIRTLQIERLYRHSPHLRRPSEPSPNSVGNVKLKSMIVVSSTVQIRGGAGAVWAVLELKSDATCQIKCGARGFVNSFNWGMSPDRRAVAVPIPVFGADFKVEIIPDLKSAVSGVKEGFVIVGRHSLIFRFAGLNDARCPQYDFLKHILNAGGQDYHLNIGERCGFVKKEPGSVCLICGMEQATASVADCAHKIICTTCKNDRDAVFSSCPFC